MRKYSSYELLRFLRFAKENTEIKGFELIRSYNEKYPELTAKDKLINLSKALKLNGLHKAITGEDIDKNDPIYKDWNEVEGSQEDQLLKNF